MSYEGVMNTPVAYLELLDDYTNAHPLL